MLMDEEKWGLLPSANLQQVFRNSEVFDVEKCLLVCKNWSFEADYYLKDKVSFVAGNVQSTEHCKVSNRKFTSIHIDSSKTEQCNALEALKMNSDILEAKLTYTDVKVLSKTMKLLGKKVKTLHLVNLEPESDYEGEDELQSFPSVETLTLENFHGSVEPLVSKKFTNLKSLILLPVEFMASIDSTFIRNFCSLNPCLRNFQFNTDLCENVDDLFPILVQLKKLRSLQLGFLYEEEDYAEILKFKELRKFRLGQVVPDCDPKYVKALFQHPSVTHFVFKNNLIGNDFWKEVFSNIHHPLVTHLEIHDEGIKETALLHCLDASPNIIHFAVHTIESIPINFFQEMSVKWPNLQVLDLESGIESVDRSAELSCNFPNLVKLTLHGVGLLPYVNFLKAENLRTLHFEETIFLPTTIEQLHESLYLENIQKFPSLAELHFLVKKENLIKVPKDTSVFAHDILILKEIFKVENTKLKVILGSQCIFKSSTNIEEFCREKGAVIEYKKDVVRRIMTDNLELFWKP